VDSPINQANDNLGTIKIVFRDGVGTEIGSGEATIVHNATPLGTWKRHTVVAKAPAGTVTVEPFILFTQPTNQGGAMFVDDAVFCQTAAVDAPVVAAGSREAELRQNVPNPFTPSTRIDFVLDREAHVDLTVYDVSGRHVATLLQGRRLPSGLHDVTWDGTTLSGARAAAGVYHYVLRTPDGQTSRNMMLVR
jgi:hypothetical protein